MTQPATTPTSVTAPQAAVTLGTATESVLRAGTPVALRMAEELTTKEKKLRVGQRFNLEIAEPVVVGSQTIIPAGAPAVGEVTDVRNKGMWGKSGRINARILYVRVNGRQIRLTGALDDKGVTGTAGVVGAVALVPIAGFFMTGTSAKIPMGAPVKGFIDEDVPFQVSAVAAPVPMLVAPATPVSPTPTKPVPAAPQPTIPAPDAAKPR